MLAGRFVVAGGSRLALRFPSARSFSAQPPSRTTTGETKLEGSSTVVEEHKPLYATKAAFKKKAILDRHKSADIENGLRPTVWQRRFLVVTRLYKKQADIPEIVGNGTMKKMKDRMRLLFILSALLGIHFVFMSF